MKRFVKYNIIRIPSLSLNCILCPIQAICIQNRRKVDPCSQSHSRNIIFVSEVICKNFRAIYTLVLVVFRDGHLLDNYKPLNCFYLLRHIQWLLSWSFCSFVFFLENRRRELQQVKSGKKWNGGQDIYWNTISMEKKVILRSWRP